MAPSSSLLTASILLLVMFADAWWQRFAYTPEQSRSCRRAFKDSLKHGYRVPPLVVKDSYGYRYMSLVDEVIPETKLVQAAVVAERPATPATDMVMLKNARSLLLHHSSLDLPYPISLPSCT